MISKVKLRPYQEKILQEILEKKPAEGIINMSVGSGKTLMALEIINQLQLTATILVQNTVLLNQFKEECKTWYAYEPGIINAKEKKIKDITIATWQSLQSNEKLLKELSENTSVLIIDECQGIVADGRMKILDKFKPTYLYGLSGSPFRSDDDGRTEAIKFLLGDIIVDYENTLMTPTVEVIRTGAEIMMSHNYHEIVDAMVHNTERNKLIVGLVTMELLERRKVLVLTKRIEHYKLLQEMLPARDDFFFIDSEDKERNNLLNKFSNGEKDFSAIFGTTSLLAVGANIPAIETIIFCSDLKSNVLTIQMAGRILRLFVGKQEPKIIDLFDEKNPILKTQFYARKKVYESKKWKISF